MNNLPSVKLGVVAVSRDCFPISLSHRRRDTLTAAYGARYGDIVKIPTIIENEKDAVKALEEVRAAGVNALVIYLGNFGPEGPETLLAQRFGGPVMFAAAAEESGSDLVDGRGDAYCGMLNASYSLKLRGVKAYIPEYPVGTSTEVADMIHDFETIARIMIGLKGLKVISFGPRPQDFLACNAPIKGLFDLGISIEENSELDLFEAYQHHTGDSRIPEVMADMEAELGGNNPYAAVLPRLAQYELTLLDWVRDHKGASEYVVMANKCWPAFQTQFGFVPCYVNSRFALRNIPIACEVDIWGAVSEYIACCATGRAPTLLDINNTVPADIYQSDIQGKFPYTQRDTFMGFHCGNTPACYLCNPHMGYQLIMKRTLEPDGEPDISRGTLEGDLKSGEITFFRLQSAADTSMHSYVAQGEILPVATRSFGGIGIFAIPQMGRFYRHVLIEKGYPHHGAVAFGHVGRAIFAAMKLMGVEDVSFNQPVNMLYKNENPFG
jgi:L-fucose isomerase-like protein